MSKYELCEYFDKNQVTGDNVLRNKLFNLIVSNGWLEYYNEKFLNDFGL